MVDLLTEGKEKCCGCGICVLVCPKQAITLVPHELGCLYPKIDQKLCVGCGLCERSCAYRSGENRNSDILSTYAAAADDAVLLQKSASGGVFASLAKQILKKGGVVFGCALKNVNGNLTPVHIGVGEESELYKLQGSKYVQSDLGKSFLQIKDLLARKQLVLFSGTPCQVDALRHFLSREDTSGLFTIDLICHGVPSAELFSGYLDEMKVGEIESFCFRDKTLGWGLNASYVSRDRHCRTRTHLLPTGISSYYTYFLDGETYRESCYSCRFASASRVGDLTIGDFWGIEQEHGELLYDNGGRLDVHKGISAILVNTPKGTQLLENYGQSLEMADSAAEKVIKWNRQLRAPSSHTGVREELIQIYKNHGYPGVERYFRKKLGIRYFVRKLRNIHVRKN